MHLRFSAAGAAATHGNGSVGLLKSFRTELAGRSVSTPTEWVNICRVSTHRAQRRSQDLLPAEGEIKAVIHDQLLFKIELRSCSASAWSLVFCSLLFFIFN